MEPRRTPKRGLSPVAHRDGGSRVENSHIRLATRVPRSDPNLIGVLPLKPRPPYFLGRHTASQLTLHFAPVVEFLADQRNARSILFMKFKVPGGIPGHLIGIMWLFGAFAEVCRDQNER
jgi:hypothetical protein